jgi:hypothetical protein
LVTSSSSPQPAASQSRLRRDVLEQQRPAAAVHHFARVVGQDLQILRRARDRVQVAEVDVARPGEGNVLRDVERIGGLDDPGVGAERGAVERPRRPEREPQAVHEEGIAAPQLAEPVVAAVEEMLRGDLEAADLRRPRGDPPRELPSVSDAR